MSAFTSKLSAAAVMAVAAAAVPLAVATPAHADVDACMQMLKDQEAMGEEFRKACAAGADGRVADCFVTLMQQEVERRLAVRACAAADRES